MPQVKSFIKLDESPMGDLFYRVESYKSDLRKWAGSKDVGEYPGAIRLGKDGKVSVGFGRTDLGRLYYSGVGNIWINQNLSYEVWVSDVEFSEEEVQQIKRAMDEFIQNNLTHLQQEGRFFEWLYGDGWDIITGTTPEEALAAIEAAGF